MDRLLVLTVNTAEDEATTPQGAPTPSPPRGYHCAVLPLDSIHFLRCRCRCLSFSFGGRCAAHSSAVSRLVFSRLAMLRLVMTGRKKKLLSGSSMASVTSRHEGGNPFSPAAVDVIQGTAVVRPPLLSFSLQTRVRHRVRHTPSGFFRAFPFGCLFLFSIALPVKRERGRGERGEGGERTPTH